MFLWVRGTPFGAPDEPGVKIIAASLLPPFLGIPSSLVSNGRGSILPMTVQRMICFLMRGSILSTWIRSRLGGQGKLETFLTNGSAVMNLSTSACFIADLMASVEAEKLRLTGIFSARTTARLAIMPALPGGRMMATRSFFVASLISLENAMAAPNNLSNVSELSSAPSWSARVLPCFLSPLNKA